MITAFPQRPGGLSVVEAAAAGTHAELLVRAVSSSDDCCRVIADGGAWSSLTQSTSVGLQLNIAINVNYVLTSSSKVNQREQ